MIKDYYISIKCLSFIHAFHKHMLRVFSVSEYTLKNKCTLSPIMQWFLISTVRKYTLILHSKLFGDTTQYSPTTENTISYIKIKEESNQIEGQYQRKPRKIWQNHFEHSRYSEFNEQQQEAIFANNFVRQLDISSKEGTVVKKTRRNRVTQPTIWGPSQTLAARR